MFGHEFGSARSESDPDPLKRLEFICFRELARGSLLQVSWIHVDRQVLLTTQTTVRTKNSRIGIVRHNDTFVLVIDKATLDDVGYYACRVRRMD